MADYSDKTRQGYEILAYYIKPKTDEVIAVFYRPNRKDYGLAVDYDMRTGTWGRGVYDLSYNEAKDFLIDMDAKPVKDINNVFSVMPYDSKNIYDTFGILDTTDSFTPIFKRAYKIAKQRDIVKICNMWGDKYGVVYLDGQTVLMDWNGKTYRIKSDGSFGRD